MKKIWLGLLCMMLLSPLWAVHISGFGNLVNALAQMYGVNLQSLTELKNLTSANELLAQVSQQSLDAQQQQTESMTGHYGMGNLANSSQDQDLQLWSADTWQDMLNQAGGGNQQRVQQLMEGFNERYPAIEAQKIVPGQPDHVKAKLYEEGYQTNRAVKAGASYIYEDVNRQIRQLQELLSYVEKTPNQKAALDLNARLVAQLGFIQLQSLRMQAMQTQLLSLQTQAQTNGIATDTQFLTQGETQ